MKLLNLHKVLSLKILLVEDDDFSIRVISELCRQCDVGLSGATSGEECLATRAQNAGLFGGDPQKVPQAAITLGLKEILEATEIHLVVTGSGKAAILQKLPNEGPSEQLPASWLRQHGCVWLWVDRAAMG